MAKTRSELEAMTKDELVDYADDIDVDVHQSWLKDDMISAILEGQGESTDTPAKQAAEQEQSVEQPVAQATEEPVDQPQVDPEVARDQTLANAPPDDSTRFASKSPEEGMVRRDSRG